MATTNYFFHTIEHLRNYEEILLYGNILEITNQDQEETLEYLSKEYKQEQIHYPTDIIPGFSPEAALWAAKTLYISAQLMLYRNHEVSELSDLLPSYSSSITPSAHLSADLTFRFLPDIINQLKLIDPDDALITLLEKHLAQWHYSGVRYELAVDHLDFISVFDDNCLTLLYIDRVIEHKRKPIALHPLFSRHIKASLGMYTDIFWNDLLKQEIFADGIN